MAANRHTHNFRECSHASVGLTQARPKYTYESRCSTAPDVQLRTFGLGCA